MVFYENKNLNSELTVETETKFGKTKCNILLEDPCGTYGEYAALSVELDRQELEEFILHYVRHVRNYLNTNSKE